MSTMSTIGTSGAATAAANESARLELGMAAAAASRRNRPKGLIVVTTLLLVGACVYALVQARARSAAIRDLEARRTRLGQIEQLGQELEQMKTRQAIRGLEADPYTASKLETMAAAANFKLTGPVSDSDAGGGVTGLVQRKYSARAQNQNPVALLTWLQMTQGTDIPQLEIARVSIRPGSAEGAYNADIDFTRWEKRK